MRNSSYFDLCQHIPGDTRGPNAPDPKVLNSLRDGGPDETEVICSKCGYPYFTAVYDECPRCKKCEFCGLTRYDSDVPFDGPPNCCKKAHNKWKKEREDFITRLNGKV